MEKKMHRSHLFCLFVLLLAVFVPGTENVPKASAGMMSIATGTDSTMSHLSSAHAVAEVREAIRACRQGDYETAVPVLRKYASTNDIGATFVLAKLHQAGLGVEQSATIAADYFQRNAKAGHAPSLIALGEIRENSNPAEAISFYEQATANGHPLGNLKLGDIYERGLLGKKANPQLAFSNYEKAAKVANPLGYYHLARCYDQGIGTSPDELAATRAFLKSAMRGVPMAQVTMARRYYEGKGLEKDPIAAFGWLSLAAQSGSTEAMVLLGRRYESGDIIPQKLDLAGQLYSNAAKRGDPSGKYFLALLYASGKGTKQDLVRAYTLLHDSAKSLPMAKDALDKLEQKMSAQQKDESKKKIAEAEANADGDVKKAG